MKLFKYVLDTKVVTKHSVCASVKTSANDYSAVSVPSFTSREMKCCTFQSLVFYLLVDPGAPESHLVLLHLEPP